MDYLYKEDTSTIPAYRFGQSATPPEGYLLITSVAAFAASWGSWDLATYYLSWRMALKSYIVDMGAGNEENGFNAIPTAQEKAFAAAHNIGTGAQRLAAIPDDQERDLSCFNYILYNEGIGLGTNGQPAGKQQGGVWAKAMAFSRCDHIEVVPGVSMPNWIFIATNIQQAQPWEISGSLLDLYKFQGIKGICLSGAPMGIADYIQETATPIDTRYSPANGGGLRTNAALVAAVAATPISGCATLGDFADLMLYIIQRGVPPYLVG